MMNDGEQLFICLLAISTGSFKCRMLRGSEAKPDVTWSLISFARKAFAVDSFYSVSSQLHSIKRVFQRVFFTGVPYTNLSLSKQVLKMKE